MNIRIYTVTRKPFSKPDSDIYVPIVSGADEISGPQFDDYILDNVGDNISSNERIYSEFAAVYWIWKNATEEYVGENHYRRYFISGSWLEYMKLQFSKHLSNNCAITEEEIEKIFEAGYNCIILKKQAHFDNDMYDFYVHARTDGRELFKLLEKIISEKYPEYLTDYHIMLHQKVSHFKCISIMPKTIFDKMIEWLFGIFEELEKIDYPYKNREFAFLGEWLINVWIIHNKNNGTIKPKELFYVNTECTIGQGTYNKYETIWPIWISWISSLRYRILLMVKRFVKGNRNFS